MSIAHRFPKVLLILSLGTLSLISGCGSDEQAEDKPDNGFVVVNENEDNNQISVPVNPQQQETETIPSQPMPNTPPGPNVIPPAPANVSRFGVISLLADRLGEATDS